MCGYREAFLITSQNGGGEARTDSSTSDEVHQRDQRGPHRGTERNVRICPLNMEAGHVPQTD